MTLLSHDGFTTFCLYFHFLSICFTLLHFASLFRFYMYFCVHPMSVGCCFASPVFCLFYYLCTFWDSPCPLHVFVAIFCPNLSLWQYVFIYIVLDLVTLPIFSGHRGNCKDNLSYFYVIWLITFYICYYLFVGNIHVLYYASFQNLIWSQTERIQRTILSLRQYLDKKRIKSLVCYLGEEAMMFGFGVCVQCSTVSNENQIPHRWTGGHTQGV